MIETKIGNPPKSQEPGLRVIHAGLFRTATASMAVAYRTLGYRTHHGLDDVFTNPWPLIERAAEATWPSVNSSRTPPFTKADWDQIWGTEYDVCTDLASPFVEQLIKSYPDAKVVIVKRDFEKWWPSFKSQVLDTLFDRNWFFTFWIPANILRIRAPQAMEKVHYGFFSVQQPEDITEEVAHQTYEAYYERIRNMVPAEKRLEYTMGDGWEPLCEFLGKHVPDLPFPRINEREWHEADAAARAKKAKSMAWAAVLPYLIGGIVVGVSAVAWRIVPTICI